MSDSAVTVNVDQTGQYIQSGCVNFGFVLHILNGVNDSSVFDIDIFLDKILVFLKDHAVSNYHNSYPPTLSFHGSMPAPAHPQ